MKSCNSSLLPAASETAALGTAFSEWHTANLSSHTAHPRADPADALWVLFEAGTFVRGAGVP